MAKKTEVTLEDKLRALYDLQLIDSRVDEIRNVRGEFPLEVEDLVNESIVQASEIKETFTDRLEGLNKTLLLKINSIEKKCSSTDEKIVKELHNNSTELSKVKNSLEQNRAHLKRVFLNRSNKPKKKYQY